MNPRPLDRVAMPTISAQPQPQPSVTQEVEIEFSLTLSRKRIEEFHLRKKKRKKFVFVFFSHPGSFFSSPFKLPNPEFKLETVTEFFFNFQSFNFEKLP